jgi:hypothetical protein
MDAIMIKRELLGRAHGALAGMDKTAPGSGVLRELVEVIEAHAPSDDVQLIAVHPGDVPALMYVSSAGTVHLQSIDVDNLVKWANIHPVQLRLMRALLEHASETVRMAIIEMAGRDG